MRRLIASIGCLLLASCAGTAPGSIAGGTCQIVHTPEYSVRGRTAYDQRWVAVTTEALVDGCGQPRPKARPASFDAPKPRAVKQVAPKAKPEPPPKRRWWQRKGPEARSQLDLES